MLARIQEVAWLGLAVGLAMAGPTLLAAEREADMKISPQVQAIAESNNQFACDLYAQLRSSTSENVFYSPMSISTALAMTYAGAGGKTENEIAQVLRLSLPEDQAHSAFASLLAQFNASKKSPYQLHMANRLWGQQGKDFLPAFLATTRTHYGAELAQVDFMQQAEQARRQINAWVAEQTSDKIEDLMPQGAITNRTRLVLTNAIYFKGKWEHPFDKEATQQAPFTISADKQATVPLMVQKQRFRYGETKELQLLAMPYDGDALTMLVVLPKRFDGLDSLEKNLSAANLKKWSSEMEMQEVQVFLPKFELAAQLELGSLLSALGMPSAFDPQAADFSDMSGQRDLHIDAAVHQAFVEVNEEGTEAAAATGISFGVTSIPAEPKVFRADHPFVFLIQDQRSGAILFLGRLTRP